MRRLSDEAQRRALAWSGIGVAFAAAILIVNPQRELLTQDDGWAYARSVATLLQTGRYELDQWSAANMPVQIYFAGGLAKLFGYSLTLLRWSTLLLLGVLLASFYALLREVGSRRSHAVALTLALLASPVLLILSFTFMSDIHFLGWLLLALFLYVRGLRRGDSWSILLGSLAAACAIGTRQFGIAIIGGWGLTWLLAGKDTRPPSRLVALAVAAPVACALWQFASGLGEPNFTQAYRMAEQKLFLSQPVISLAREMFWRCAIWAQYLAIFLLPILPLVIGICLQGLRSAGRLAPRAMGIATLVTALVGLGLWLSSPLTVRPPIVGGPIWPALGIIWVLPTALWWSPDAQRLLDLLGFAAVFPLAWLFFSVPRPLRSLRPASPPAILLAGTGMALFALQLAYVQLNDTYIIGLLPFALLAIASRLRAMELPRFWLIVGILSSSAAILATTLWMRSSYDQQQLGWDAAEKVAAAGVPYDRISGPKHWAEYRGAFDDWIRAGAPGLAPPPTRLPIGQDPFHDPFYAWLTARNRSVSQAQSTR